MGQARRVLMERCSKCYASPKAYKMEQNQPMSKLLSEYQTAYKSWPSQPVRQTLKPDTEKQSLNRIKGQVEKKSTYGLDYVPIPNPKKVVPKKQKAKLACPAVNMDVWTTYELEYFAKTPDPHVPVNKKKMDDNSMQPSKDAVFQGDSIYMASYPVYDDKVVAKCHQRLVKKKDNIEIPPSSESEKNAQSTAKGDFVVHKEYDRPKPVRPQETNHLSSEPLQGSTEYKDSFNQKRKDPNTCRTTLANKGISSRKAISTAMADFTWPQGFEPQKPYHPPQLNHSISEKFDGTTTFSMAYKPFEVTPYKLPIWAKKSPWTKPKGGMILKSLYKHDFTDPEVIHPPKPIKPRMTRPNPIIKETEEGKSTKCVSSYLNDFIPWEGSRPPESYKVMEVYTPPKEQMNFETNNRSHFRGEYAKKRRPCRHVSEHRELNENTGITFITTYNENYQNPRPKSSPIVVSTPCDNQGKKFRCNSASPHMLIPKPNLNTQASGNPPASVSPPTSDSSPSSVSPRTSGSSPSANPLTGTSANVKTSAKDLSTAKTVNALEIATQSSTDDSTSSKDGDKPKMALPQSHEE